MPVWQPPQEGSIKCNTDRALATGVVLRDVAGNFGGGRAQCYPHGLEALTMEALALRDGMAFARDRGVQRLYLKTDSQELVKLWKVGANQRSRITPIIREAWELCSLFSDLKLMYSSRSCNQVAHTLAKQVSVDNRMEEWHSAPSCVINLVTVDSNSDGVI
jgi:ribonuclease HI